MVPSNVSRALPALVLTFAVACGAGSGGQSPTGTGGRPGSGGAGGSSTDASSSGTGGTAGNPQGGSGGSDPTGSGGAGTGGGAAGSGGTGGSIDAGTDAPRPPDGPIPTKQEYLTTLYKMVDLLSSTQILQMSSADYGALVSPGINPDRNPTYSRAAEAVYPMAVAFKHSQQAKYADTAIRLGNWLFTIQNAAGAWGEEWPNHDGWDGTTADQVISLAGAYEILKGRLTAQENTRWVTGMTRAADWIVANFPKGNVNYFPTGSVALAWSHKALPNPKAAWLTKAASLMVTTLQMINADNFITGEGNGVDLGYNIAQSIGMIALYGKLLPSPTHVDRAGALLKTHMLFMYPNGAIDNSWGTRTFKWTLESGTKTAPGIYFSFGLVADKDPMFQRGAQLALKFLRDHYFDDKGWVVHGPHAYKHPSCSPPSSYSTFARAQSIATVIELGPETTQVAPIQSEAKNWFKYFPTVKVGILRTDKVMATLTAYGEIGQYARETVVHGGSATALWFEGYGPTGFLQVSSQTRYVREEPKHMPTEGDLLPLTPRIETTTGTYASNLFDNQASLSVRQAAAGIDAVASGALRTITGGASGTTFTWTHQFAASAYSKEVDVTSGANVQIVEPFVDLPGNRYEVMGTDAFRITTQDGKAWELKVVSSSGPYQLIAGTDRAKHWMPFPAFECYPLVIRPMGSTGAYKIKYTVSQVQ